MAFIRINSNNSITWINVLNINNINAPISGVGKYLINMCDKTSIEIDIKENERIEFWNLIERQR